jgi:hypothetical protein
MAKAVGMEPETKTITEMILADNRRGDEQSRWLGYALLAAAILFLVAGVYIYLIHPALMRSIPEHQPQLLDEPPLELTSFSVRFAGEDLTPQCLELSGDSLFVSFAAQSLIQIYSQDLDLLKSFRLDTPAMLQPTAMALTDSLLIVADTVLGTIAVFDRDGYYLSSASWYPDHATRLKPVHLATHNGMLYATDMTRHSVTTISLFKREPFFDFLELLSVYPIKSTSPITFPTCAEATANGNLWIGDAQPGGVFIVGSGDSAATLAQKPSINRIVMPCDIFILNSSPDATATRVHVLDRVAGKVFVYDLEGKLRLVYPRDRELHRPTGIAIDSNSRHIFVAESETREITVFGF